MARKLEVQGAGTVKVIHPAIAFLLAIVTLGIYYIFWYGIRNSELNDFGMSASPGENQLAVSSFGAIVAITIGGLLIVPPFVSQWRFYKRIARAQELVGLEHPISHVTGILLYTIALFLLPFEVAYAQHHLNRLWEREAALMVASFQAEAASHLDEAEFQDLISELRERSPEFATLWARHDVRGRPEGLKRLDHPTLGPLDLEYTTYRVNDQPGLKLTLYVPEAGSASDRALRAAARDGA